MSNGTAIPVNTAGSDPQTRYRTADLTRCQHGLGLASCLIRVALAHCVRCSADRGDYMLGFSRRREVISELSPCPERKHVSTSNTTGCPVLKWRILLVLHRDRDLDTRCCCENAYSTIGCLTYHAKRPPDWGSRRRLLRLVSVRLYVQSYSAKWLLECVSQRR